ncbi:hypothetical protein D3C77_393960 [compost metagenome]
MVSHTLPTWSSAGCTSGLAAPDAGWVIAKVTPVSVGPDNSTTRSLPDAPFHLAVRLTLVVPFAAITGIWSTPLTAAMILVITAAGLSPTAIENCADKMPLITARNAPALVAVPVGVMSPTAAAPAPSSTRG